MFHVPCTSRRSQLAYADKVWWHLGGRIHKSTGRMQEQQYHSQDEQQNCLGDGDTQQKIPLPIDIIEFDSGETTAPGETKTARHNHRQPHQLLDALRQGRAQKEDHQHGDGESCRVHKSERHRDDNNKPERREKKDDEDKNSSSDESVQKNNVRRGLRGMFLITATLILGEALCFVSHIMMLLLYFILYDKTKRKSQI